MSTPEASKFNSPKASRFDSPKASKSNSPEVNDESASDVFEVGIAPAAAERHRSFWAGPVGTAALLVPGILVALVGLALALSSEPTTSNLFFAGVIVFSGFFAGYAGWDHRRRTLATAELPLFAFALDADGAHFPRRKHYTWSEAAFVLTDERPPRLLASPIGMAYATDRLDRSPEEIAAAIERYSGGRAALRPVR